MGPNLRSALTNKSPAGPNQWHPGISRGGAVFVFIIALFALLSVDLKGRNRQFVSGTIEDTRIVADHVSETKWGSQLIWKAEYKVAYTVASHEYSVWTDSGIRSDSEEGVHPLLPSGYASCRVQYDAGRPEAATADCR
jgi:hypothetical protein